MKQNFEQSLKYVLQSEGGWSDDPDDPGGATMHGVTLAEYRAYHQNPGLTAKDLRSITPVEVSDIYRDDYWCKIGADVLPAGIDYCGFDDAANCGVKEANAHLAQIERHGRLAPQTELQMYCDLRRQYYRRLAERRPSEAKFLKGWLNRVNTVETRAKAMIDANLSA